LSNKFIRIILFSACTSVLSLFTAAAATCDSLDGDTLAQLEGIGACTYGGFTFSNFGYTYGDSNGGSQVLASQVFVNAVTNADGSGLSFDASWDADSALATSDGDVMFTVTANAGATAISDTGLAQTAGVSGNGYASVSEQGCSGVGCVPGSWPSAPYVFDAGGGTNASSTDVLLADANSVTVSKDINANANNGAATISLVTDVFSVPLVSDIIALPSVPEPRGVALLLGLGLLAGFVVRKKFQGASA